MYPSDILKAGTTKQDLITAVAETSSLKEDDPRVVKHVEKVQEFLKVYFKVE